VIAQVAIENATTASAPLRQAPSAATKETISLTVKSVFL
jgi:hypothetical protein